MVVGIDSLVCDDWVMCTITVVVPDAAVDVARPDTSPYRGAVFLALHLASLLRFAPKDVSEVDPRLSTLVESSECFAKMPTT